jgi:uncharacterized protein
MSEPQQPGQPDDRPPAYGQQPPPYGAAPQHGHPAGPEMLSPAQVRTWSGAAHWSALVAGLVLGGLAILGPLLVMLVKGNESATVRRNAVESLNFQISTLIYALVSALLILVLVGIALIFAVMAFWLIFTIIGSVKASNGEDYRYPLTIRMVS